jgi:hypothetical protein
MCVIKKLLRMFPHVAGCIAYSKSITVRCPLWWGALDWNTKLMEILTGENLTCDN